METKHETRHHNTHETHKHNEECKCGEAHKNAGETVFELIPDKLIDKKNKKNYCANKPFSLGFLTGFLITTLLATGIIYIKIVPMLKNNSIKNPITIEQAKAKAETFINENLMAPGSKIIIKGAEEANGLYKLAVNVGSGNDIDAYITKDGKIFFKEILDIEKIENNKKNTPQPAPAAPLQKSDKPSVEVFVMSHCPFGTQIEKGILPVANALGNKINFDLKFVDYAMHGEKELKEELAQYCIKTGEPAKFNSYLKCFIESADGDSVTCLKTAKINTSKLAACTAATDKKFKVMDSFANQTTWKNNSPTFNIYAEDNAKYGVQGSPTLVINGTTTSSARDSASLLKTICAAFNTPPKECETALSAAEPAPGFGTATGTGAPSASCGS